MTSGDNMTRDNSQSLANLHGKVLRINTDGSIPVTNPFFDQATGKNRAIWTLGLRNPFKIAFRPGSATVFINDVGENTLGGDQPGLRGANYGWPIHEGPEIGPVVHGRRSSPTGTGSTATTGCAITGGTFYNPRAPAVPGRLRRRLLLCRPLHRLDPALRPGDRRDEPHSPPTRTTSAPVDLEVGSGGSLYVLSTRRGGSIDRIRYVG